MSILKKEDSHKWIRSFIAICSVILGYVVIQFVGQLSIWFNLEASIPNFLAFQQGLGILVGLGFFIFLMKHPKSMNHIQEVYGELLKVVWPDRETVVRITIGIIIGVSILSGIFLLVDYLTRQLLQLLY